MWQIAQNQFVTCGALRDTDARNVAAGQRLSVRIWQSDDLPQKSRLPIGDRMLVQEGDERW
jgi:hypothetical protein